MLFLNRIALFCAFISCSIWAMVQPPQQPKASWHSLPADVKRYALQCIASSKVYEVAETIKALNATDRACHGLMQSEHVVMSILQRMPYFANQLDLIDRLKSLPVMASFEGHYCILKSRLRDSHELSLAIFLGNTNEQIHRLLRNKNVNLNGGGCCPTALKRAVFEQNIEAVKCLLNAGANPDTDGHSPLCQAIVRKNKEIVTLLLEAGADPDPFKDHLRAYSLDTTSEILQLIREARKKRKEKMRLLHGKKKDGCVIS